MGVVHAGTMRLAVEETRMAYRDMLLSRDPLQAERRHDVAGELAEPYRTALADYQHLNPTPEQAQLADRMSRELDTYLAEVEKVLVPLAEAKQYDAWAQDYEEKGAPWSRGGGKPRRADRR